VRPAGQLVDTAPHRCLDPRRSDQPCQRGAALLLPPSPRSRGRVAGDQG